VGVNSFKFNGLSPDPSKIPSDDLLRVAALISAESYNDKVFVGMGYNQNVVYDDERR